MGYEEPELTVELASVAMYSLEEKYTPNLGKSVSKIYRILVLRIKSYFNVDLNY